MEENDPEKTSIPDDKEREELIKKRKSEQISFVIEMIPKLLRGLDVNVKFEDADSFEFTQELSIFDAYNIRCYHGWVVDKVQDVLTWSILSNKCISYNECVNKMVTFGSEHTDPHKQNRSALTMDEYAIINTFLNDTAGQLTYFGLERLHHHTRESEIGILFRNNHFNVMYRRGGKLYVLLTDEGYCHPHSSNLFPITPDSTLSPGDQQQMLKHQDMHDQSTIVWEYLSDINGDTDLVNAHFRLPHTDEDVTAEVSSVVVTEPTVKTSSEIAATESTHTPDGLETYTVSPQGDLISFSPPPSPPAPATEAPETLVEFGGGELPTPPPYSELFSSTFSCGQDSSPSLLVTANSTAPPNGVPTTLPINTVDSGLLSQSPPADAAPAPAAASITIDADTQPLASSVLADILFPISPVSPAASSPTPSVLVTRDDALVTRDDALVTRDDALVTRDDALSDTQVNSNVTSPPAALEGTVSHGQQEVEIPTPSQVDADFLFALAISEQETASPTNPPTADTADKGEEDVYASFSAEELQEMKELQEKLYNDKHSSQKLTQHPTGTPTDTVTTDSEAPSASCVYEEEQQDDFYYYGSNHNDNNPNPNPVMTNTNSTSNAYAESYGYSSGVRTRGGRSSTGSSEKCTIG